MTTRARRVARRLLEVFDYRTFAVAGFFAAFLIVGWVVFSAFQAAHDATVSADRRGKAASRRVDMLNSEIQQLERQIVAGQDERGQLAAKVDALSEQVRQLGGRPVVAVTVSPEPELEPTPPPMASSRPSSTPAPHPTRTVRPTPRPSPTCTRLPILGTCRPGR